MNDLLSRATEELRLRRAVYRRETIRPPAAKAFDEAAGMILVERGRAAIGFDLTLEAGDVVLLPRGEPHSIEALSSVSSSASASSVGASSVGVELIVATFEFVVADHPLLQTLPAMIHIPAARLGIDGGPWAKYRASLVEELARPPSHPGRETMLVRLSDVMLIEAMRHAPPPKGTECPVGGFLGGAPDDVLSRVLSAIHAEPGRAWTVASLADIAGQSRSAFAAHFASVMNEPPMAYLVRWRMFRARTLLRAADLSMDEIAVAIGYGSAAAFSLAFTREHGIAPGAFRRDAQRSSTTDRARAD